MYSSGQATIRKSGASHYRTGRKRIPARHRPQKEDYGSVRGRNAFLTQRIPLIAPDRVTRDTDVKNFNFINRPNYEYLLDSARRYAGLLGHSIEHHPEDSPGAGIINVYNQLDGMVGDAVGVNIRPSGSRLEFVLWERYKWGEYGLYWIPLQFIERLPVGLRRLAITFFHQFNERMRFGVPGDSDMMEYVIEWQYEFLEELDEDERNQRLNELANYKKGGKIHRFMERIIKRNYYKDLHRALAKYEPATDSQRKLIGIMQEGMKFIGEDVPTIFSYEYDEYFDEDDYEDCVELAHRFMLIYNHNDCVIQGYMEYLNDLAGNSYEVFPCATLILTPDTDELLTKDPFPGELFGFLDKLCDIINELNDELQ